MEMVVVNHTPTGGPAPLRCCSAQIRWSSCWTAPAPTHQPSARLSSVILLTLPLSIHFETHAYGRGGCSGITVRCSTWTAGDGGLHGTSSSAACRRRQSTRLLSRSGCRRTKPGPTLHPKRRHRPSACCTRLRARGSGFQPDGAERVPA